MSPLCLYKENNATSQENRLSEHIALELKTIRNKRNILARLAGNGGVSRKRVYD